MMFCAVIGKERHPTEAKARKAIAEMAQRGAWRGGAKDVYRCRSCGDWHVTSRDPGDLRRLRNGTRPRVV